MPADRFDVIVLGADIEGLFAAASLAAAGRHVVVLDPGQPGVDRIDGDDCLVSVVAVSELDLVSHGLRLSAPRPIIGVSREHSLVLWPEADATLAGIAMLSARDADAFEGFSALVRRGAAGDVANSDFTFSNWHLGSGADASSEISFLRSTSIERVLDEAFTLPLLKGMLAQSALLGTGVSPRAPGSACLLMRQSLLSLLGDPVPSRHVAGGYVQLKQSLLASLKFFNNAEVRQVPDVKSLIFERDSVSGVVLGDGTSVKAADVISTLRHERLRACADGTALFSPQRPSFVLPGQIQFRVRTAPVFRGVSPGLSASGAVMRINPSLERLVRSHGAYRSRQLLQDFCLDLRVVAAREPIAPPHWDVFADVLHVPSATSDGPWSGNRRDRFVAAVTQAIEVWAPGFENSIESSALLEPVEARSIVEAGSTLSLELQSNHDPLSVPDMFTVPAESLQKGLWSIEPSLIQGAGLAGLNVARALGAPVRGKVSSDA